MNFALVLSEFIVTRVLFIALVVFILVANTKEMLFLIFKQALNEY